MECNRPTQAQIPQLLSLWKQAFGEHNGYWELFLETAYTPEHCRCITEGDQVTAALFWFDVSLQGEKIAYLYGVVTHPDHRGKGLCRALMEDTRVLLTGLGYSGILLKPEKESLREMYRKLGYRDSTRIRSFRCTAAETAVSLRAIGPEEFARLRRIYLPQGGVIQEETCLSFLAAQLQFYAGSDFLLAAWQEDGILTAPELLGNAAAAPGILCALSCREGDFRTPGDDLPFAMYRPLIPQAVVPGYLGFAFD